MESQLHDMALYDDVMLHIVVLKLIILTFSDIEVDISSCSLRRH